MATAKKTINKLARRAKHTKKKARGFDRYDKTFKNEEVMAESPRVLELMRKTERRMDRSWGNDILAQKPALSTRDVVASLQRFDYGVGDYGTRMTLANAAQNGYSSAALRVGDLVEVVQKGSAWMGRYLKVVALTDSTHLRLEDLPSAAYPGAKESTSVTTVADSAGSLNSKDWLLSTHTTNYYVWYNVAGAGVDPAVGGRTGIMVAIATNATATAVATATKAALDAVSGAWTTTQNGAQLTVTNQAVGTATDAANGTASPGFTIAVLTQGANANPTPAAETNVTVRMEVSSVKSSYV